MKINNLSKMCHKATAYLKRNSSTILTYLSVAGVVITTLSAIKATPKAVTMLENAERSADKEEIELTIIDKAKIVVPIYIPTILIGTSTIACIFGANILNKRQQASILSAYSLLDNYHKSYRSKLIELKGKEIDEEIRNAIARERCDFHQIGLDTPDDKFIFYDEISGQSITCYEREIMDAEYHLNRNFVLRGYASLNEFYEFLGLPQTDYGDSLGWSISYGYGWIDFEHRLISKDDGGIPVYAIDFIFSPEVDYMSDWE